MIFGEKCSQTGLARCNMMIFALDVVLCSTKKVFIVTKSTARMTIDAVFVRTIKINCFNLTCDFLPHESSGFDFKSKMNIYF